ncbi:MAG: ornithine cyclodeaminase [Rhodospirillaceae bacterium]|jgi:ornithine cyclodeaminase/alanine dehydrogenase-like protein (mu-crystallin family)|nr:ornithine cyclodeaminase [Rhodospirillaceae bacterium]MBT5562842.1 ornithine cyclodeaminase [Rhodospirillaceae bacterium]MBT6243245.1 ornithine cyclodeaminase [Rhodospirillaceae bacterium]
MTVLIEAGSIEDRLSWSGVADAIEAGHKLPRAEIADVLMQRDDDSYLSRSAHIDGLGFATKSVTVVPSNTGRGLPAIHGAMMVFDDVEGRVEAVLDSALVTRWKTAADSVLGGRILARSEARKLLVLGAGAVSGDLVRAYTEVFPALEGIEIWNRTPDRAVALVLELAEEGIAVAICDDLAESVRGSDIVAAATMASEPIIKGEWVSAGTHVDLVGAFTPHMREADDELMAKACVFVDSRETTLNHIGELIDPIANGAITEKDVLADLYDLADGQGGRKSPEDITLFKNGGGAHLDLMTARYIMKQADRHD